MSQPNKINRIFIDEGIEVTHIDNTLLAFNSGLIMPKSTYSIVDNAINVTTQIDESLALYYFRSKSSYFEYSIDLRDVPITITGTDKNGKALSGLTGNTPLIFVDGKKLQPGEYIINDDNSFTLYTPILNKKFTPIIVYCCSEIVFMGNVMASRNWDPTAKTLIIQDTTLDRYIFFLNGKAIRKDQLQFDVDGTVHFNLDMNVATDYLEYYRFPENAVSLIFEADPGYFAYGPKDVFNNEVPELYDAVVTFEQHIAKLAIDDLRPGFFIREVDTEGCLMVIDEDYEHYSIKCLTIEDFTNTQLSKDQFYIQVPDAKSILYYVSEFDLSQKLFPELLGTFQKVLLNETYDSIQRIKNLRNLHNVNSKNINNLIDFLGFDQRITDMPLEQKHQLLEELNNFYRIAGTRASYNFYNIISSESKILDIEQLFTPIKDNTSVEEWEPGAYYLAGKSVMVIHDGEYYYCKEEHKAAENWESDKIYWVHTTSDASEKRYVTFYNAEDLGASYKRKYEYPYTDYGKIGQLANPTDILSNEPHGTGKLQDNSRFVELVTWRPDGPNAYYKETRTYPVISMTGEWHVYTHLIEHDELDWQSETYYQGGQNVIVKHDDKFYCCKQAHKSELTWDLDEIYWHEVTVKPEIRFMTPNTYNPAYLTVGPNKATEGFDRGYVSDFEYVLDLSNGYTLIEGADLRGATLDDLRVEESQIYINGKRLLPTEYTILSPTLLLIIGKYTHPQVVYMEARTFIPADGVNGDDYEPYYYMCALDEDNHNCYNNDGSNATGVGIYSDYQIQWRKVTGGVEYYIQTSSTTELIIGRGNRAATFDKYVYTDNINCPYASLNKAFNGDVLHLASYDVTDYSCDTDNGDLILNKYIASDTDVVMPNIRRVNVTWYINPENVSTRLSRTFSEVLYPVFNADGERIYYGNDHFQIFGLWHVDNEGTLTDIEFVYFDNNNRMRSIGNGTRVIEDDIKIEREVDNNAQVDIWKSDMTPVNIYDYGYVWEQIKGKWIEWFEWDRPAGWYPTNHVDVSLQIPADANYDEFINEFKKTFYDIASTVLYIHNIVNVYTFGYNENNFGIMTAPTYHTIEVTLTNHPSRQPGRIEESI